uniref:Ribosomal RNA small subunit methyltransferase D n=1 Tax=Candidatus Kentrum sp. TUN TaxID=2126343 RepID=A0A451AF79_9GAMM|nr:MAG: 16S rRNA (guanine966-N2)-methyltransferase [Candidatus Kentron sp. TUN]VFK64696.1 MAG: 16S rRNA (guanine966-N2)-methyltransferase [Candidatus Kentron sp. TUN]VFK69917.1 MAG: 16S rRNA (guanine966-N2)-methyltransferase [Candidatus Kentron sp. TUN]
MHIIAGRWKRRRLIVPNVPGLRPTPGRVKETLFNWLGARICDARCLDLFAGSGALGFEAASRGASKVVLVEQHKAIADNLLLGVRKLAAREVTVVHSDALRYLKRSPQHFDVVFLDPPFDSDLLEKTCRLLNSDHWLHASARIYLEMRRPGLQPTLPDEWELIHSSVAGDVRYLLAGKREPIDA